MGKGAREPPKTATPSDDSTQEKLVRVAGLWRRLIASVVDALVLTPILMLVGWLALKITGTPVPQLDRVRVETVLESILEGGTMLYSGAALGVAILLLYGCMFMTLTGATPGLRLLRMRVINVYGESPEWWRMILRGCGFVVSCLVLGLGFIWIGFDREKRGLADWMAGTYVIRQQKN